MTVNTSEVFAPTARGKSARGKRAEGERRPGTRGGMSSRPARTQPGYGMCSIFTKRMWGSGSGLTQAHYCRSCRAAWAFGLVSRGGVRPSLRSRRTCPGLVRPAPLARRHRSPLALGKRHSPSGLEPSGGRECARRGYPGSGRDESDQPQRACSLFAHATRANGCLALAKAPLGSN